MWEIYDELIDLIPENKVIKSFLAGLHWFLVHSEDGIGMSMTPKEGINTLPNLGKISGRKVRDIAMYIKSWNNYEAALGLAAINSFINAPKQINQIIKTPLSEQIKLNAFEYMKDRIKGKKVGVIGHFYKIEELEQICELTVLERRPTLNDIPDPACEYILPEQDYVFITGSTLINKTLPRLLELAKNSYVSLVGPSTPVAPFLFDYGIDMLAGNIVIEYDKVWNMIQEGGMRGFFYNGAKTVKIIKDESIMNI